MNIGPKESPGLSGVLKDKNVQNRNYESDLCRGYILYVSSCAKWCRINALCMYIKGAICIQGAVDGLR